MLSWDKTFETNIEMVDLQHKCLINLINELNREVIGQMEFDNYDRIMTILSELKEYTVEHFRQEELLMKETMATLNDMELAEFWPYFKNHKAEHTAFVDKIEEVFRDNIDEKQEEISLDLISFLVDWLKNHILKIDMQLPKYIK